MVGKVLYIKYNEVVDGQLVEKVRYAVDRWQADDKYMGESFITFTIKSPKPIAFSVGDYCEYRGETYTLNYIPSVSQKANIGGSGEAFVYEQVKMDSPREELDRAIMLDVTPTTGDYVAALGTNYTGSSQFQLYCGETTANGKTLTPVCALAAKIQANLDRAFPDKGWKVLVDTTSTHEEAGQQVLNTHSDEKMLTFDNTTIANALAEVKNTFEIDFAVKGRTIYIGYTFGAITGNEDGNYYYFGYGRGYLSEDNQGKALFELKRTSDSGQKIVTRLRALGSTKNMPYRYYNKRYNLSQSLFPTNLQLPDTFETPEIKAKHNKERKAVYPWIRDVLGDTNDAYIDKNDNCLETVEGLREDCMRWDGSNADLKEIYPSIEEVTYGELRAALCEDQDGNSGTSAFPHYANDERVDEILAIDTDTNVGDGILTESDSTRQTATDAEVRFTVSETSSSLNYNGSAYVSPEREVMSISSQYAGSYIITNSHLWFRASYSLGRHQSENITKSCSVAYQIKVYAKDLSSLKETVICTYVSDYKTITNRDTKEYEIQVTNLPDIGATPQKVEKILLTNLSDIRITFALLVKDIEYSYDQWSVTWNMGLSRYGTPDTDTEWTPSLIWDLEGSAASFMKNPFHVYVKDMGFDFVAAFGTSDTPKIAMKSGMCVAREFAIGDNPQKVEYTKNGITYKAWRLTLGKAEDSSLKTYYPSETSPLAAGDNFVIIGIEMPEVYIQAASMKLLVEATKALADVCDTKHEYEPSVDDIYIQRNYDRCEEEGDVTKSVYWKLGSGMKFPFFGIAEENKEIPDMFTMIIDTLTIKEGDGLTPKITIKLSEDFQQSTLQKLTRQVTSITNGSIFNSANISAGGGLNESEVKAIISEFAKKRFLSKLNPDTAAGIITFLQGTKWGNFTSETGAAMTIDPTTGQTYMEVDRLKVRLKAFFEHLEIQKVGFVGGKLIVTKGQGVDILDVENIYDFEGNISAYRCYFLGEQEGRKIDNLLRVKDQMICKDFNVSEGSTDGATNKYYWRLATAVSSDVVKRGNNVCHWVDLSATDCDTNSDVPEIGDTICHLGNREDTDRQGAEILSVVDANSPSFTIYSGINSYSLVNKEYIDMGVVNGKAYCNIYGSTYIGDRERQKGYLRWNDDTKTFEIKGTIDITSPLSSGGTIGGAIDNAANAYKGEFDAFTSNVNEVIGGFQAQIDGVIETWFYEPEPTLGNEPAVNWTDNATKDKHLGDLYYSGEGKAYRFQKDGDNYVWQPITDTDIAKALEEAKKANDAANTAQGTADSKMRVFVVQPTADDEYSVGDMWVNATYPADGSTYNNEILHCVTAKDAGAEFQIAHWAQSSNIKTQFNNFVNNTYTEDKADFYDQLDGKVETWYQTEDPKNKWSAADYSKHKGDIWYNDSENKSYRWTGTAWVELKDQAAIDAKTLAESKNRVFTTTALPTPPYDKKDLWVQGENGDIMVCVKEKASGATASASDWEKASNYTDDTKANEALTKVGDLQTDVTELGESFNTLTNTTLPALSDGIITTSEKENIRQALMQVQKECVDVINAYTNLTVNYKSIYDKIAADVRTNFATAYTNLMGSATLSSDGTITYTSEQGGAYGALVDNINALLNKEGNLTTNEIATINNNIANFNIKYNDFQNRLVVVRNDIEKTLDTRITDVDEQLGGYAYLKKIVGGKTTIDGGLVLTTMLGTGYEVTGGAYKIMSGISGLYETAKSVAIWAGGSMIDKFVYYDAESGKFNVPADVNPANFLVRMDGTGYAAGGNFWWDNDGKIHADPQSFLINEQYVGNVMQLFQLHYKVAGDTAFTNVDYVTPTRMFNGLELSDLGLKIGDTAKLYIKDGVLFIEGDLAVTGGITMYASDGVKSGMIDQVYAILDSSKFEIENGVITIKGEIGDGKVKGATLGGVAVTLNANGILEFDAYPTTLPASDVYAWAKAATKPTYSWGEITDKPSTFTPSAHNHDDRYYTESEVDTKLTDGSVTKVGTNDVGSATLPIYLKEGVPTEVGTSLAVDITGNAATAATLQNARTLWGQSFNGSANISGNMSGVGQITFSTLSGTNGRALLYQQMADNDYFRIYVGGTATNSGYAEIATADDGTEPIYVRQYSGAFRTLKRTLTLLDGSGNTTVPGLLTAANGTINGTLKVGAIPVTNSSSGVLKIDGNLIVTGGITMYATDGIASGLMEQILVDGTTIGKKANGTLYAINTGNVRSIVMGTTTYTPNEDGIVTLPEKVTWANIEGKPSSFTPSAHTHDDRYYTESEIDDKLGLKLDTSLKGVANGLATLDSSGKVPSSQLPSYVDDVLEYDNKASFPNTGESGKIYIDKETNLTYRWGGTSYVEISQSLALGETSSTAYAGDKGKKNAEDIAALQKGKADKATTLSGYGITDAYTKTEVNTKLTDGSVTKIGTKDVGSATLPIYLKAGVPTAVGTSLAVDITGNAATATQLANARTLWGQSFDGSANVSGNMTGVGTITPMGEDLKVVGNLIVTGGIVMYADDGATIESGFAALLAAHIDGVTIKYNEAQQKIYSVMTGIKVNGTTYKPSETDGYITIPDYPTSLDWNSITNKPRVVYIGEDGVSEMGRYIDFHYDNSTGSDYSCRLQISGNNSNVLSLPTGTGTLARTVDNVASASKWATARTITLTGSVTGSVSIDGSGNVSLVTTTNHTHSYLPLSGGAMTGNITYSSADMGESYIGKGANDAANGVGGALNNLVISSWHGVSFTTSCGGQTYTNTNAVSIDCREGYVYANTFVGALSGNATSASKWATARKITLTGSVTGSVSIDGSGDVTLATTTNHTHSYLPLSGGTMTGGITFSNTSHLLWNSDTYHQRIFLTDDSTADTAVFTFQQSSDNGKSWSDLMTIRDNGKVIANTFVGALSGNAATASKLGTATVGSGTQHFYLNAGTATASTSTVGGTAKPMYLKAGVMTAISATVGGTAKPIFLNAGTLTAISDTVGGTAKPIYLNGGTLTAISTTAGSATLPVYLNAGTITACTASSVFSNLSNSGNSLSVTVAGQNRTLTVNYASNADTVDGEHSSAFAHIGAHNDLIAAGNEFTFVSSGQSGRVWLNFRTAGGTNGNITGYIFGNGAGASLGTAIHSGNYSSYALPLSGGTMTGTIYANDGAQNTGIKFKSNNANLNGLGDQHLILGKAIRFGAYNTWDWNVWAGLKYDSSSKTIYLGLADGTTFNANAAQSGGLLKFPGVSNMYINEIDAAGGDGMMAYKPSAWTGVSSSQFGVGTIATETVIRSSNTSLKHYRHGSGTYTIWDSGNDGSGSGLDADFLDGVHLNRILERDYTTTSTLSSAGWYRIAQTKYSPAHGVSFILMLSRVYSNANNESYTFSVNISYSGNISITQLSGSVNVRLITQIRIDNVTSGTNYIDVYYQGGSSNPLHCTTIGAAECISSPTYNPTLVGTAVVFSTSTGIATNKDIIAHGGITMYSDLRKKNILSDEVLSVKEIAAAPLFRHTYKSDDNQYIHVGTSAQYWSGIHEDWFTRKDGEGYYQMELQNLGVAMGISLAREIVKYESKTDKKIKLMRKRINELEARVKELEERRTA